MLYLVMCPFLHYFCCLLCLSTFGKYAHFPTRNIFAMLTLSFYLCIFAESAVESQPINYYE